jgi:hypothetical protein
MPRKSTVLTVISRVSGELYVFIIESSRKPASRQAGTKGGAHRRARFPMALGSARPTFSSAHGRAGATKGEPAGATKGEPAGATKGEAHLGVADVEVAVGLWREARHPLAARRRQVLRERLLGVDPEPGMKAALS